MKWIYIYTDLEVNCQVFFVLQWHVKVFSDYELLGKKCHLACVVFQKVGFFGLLSVEN